MDEYGHYGNIVLNISRKTRRKNRKLIFIFITFFLLLLSIGIQRILSSLNRPSESTPYSSSPSKILSETQDKNQNRSSLIKNIEREISGSTGTFSVYVYDIKNGKEYGINEQMVISAASINKIPILATLYHLAQNNSIDMEKIIVPQPSDIQDYGSGSIRYDLSGTPYSIKTLARLMMEKSDNTAAYILGSQVISLKKIQDYVESLGLTQTDIVENTTSVKDMSILMIKMYKGEVTSSSLTAEMLGFMDQSDYDDRIPASLPEDIKVYHKTGDDINKIHDVGIIDLKGKPYYLGVMTTDMTDDKTTKEYIARISRKVFDYFQNL